MTARTTRALAATVLAGSVALTGCSVDSLVGLRPPPAERTDAAPVNEDGALAIAQRTLGRASEAQQKTGKEAVPALKEAMTGSALSIAAAKATVSSTTAAPTNPLALSEPPTVVAVSQGKQWPRAILAGVLDKQSQTQYLHVLTQADPSEPYLVEVTVPMLPGAALPSLGEFASGAPLVDANDKGELKAAPNRILTAYAACLRQPKPAKSAYVETDDAFAQALTKNFAAQQKAIGTLGTVSQQHDLVPGQTFVFQLANGGVVAFGRLDRTDTITAGKNLKEFTVPEAYQKVTGKKKASKKITLTSIEAVAIVIPTGEKARVIGAVEQLAKGSAT